MVFHFLLTCSFFLLAGQKPPKNNYFIKLNPLWNRENHLGFKIQSRSELKASVKIFPKLRKIKFSEELGVVFGTYNPALPKIYQIVHMFRCKELEGKVESETQIV